LTFVREKILTLSVLDPAMGSGHFLVNATNLISNFITDFMNELGFEGETITSTAYWRRWVVENCIYGVDLNPLAVELAKLSLWILSMAKDQPLSFTNHHLKCGNSLVGARLDEIGNYPFSNAEKEPLQLNMFEGDASFRAAVQDAIAKSHMIASRASLTLEDVEEKKSWLAEIESDLEGYKAISHVHTDLYFGSSIKEDDYLRLVGSRNFILAAELAHSHRFFNWELEFPEVFFQGKGFSCIVCNPPYDTFKENSYFARSEAVGTGNLFSHFIVKAVHLNSDGGNLGFVIPLSLACGESYESIRKLIYREYDDLNASHYSIRPAKLFPGVDQRITIFYTTHKTSKGKCKVRSSRFWRWSLGDEEKVVNSPGLGLAGYQQAGLIPKVAGDIGAAVYKKVLNAPIKLQALINGGEYIAYYHAIARYWIKTYDFIPHFSREGESRPSKSSTLGTLGFSTEFNKYLFLLLTNSSLFYYWWIARGDEFHVLTSDFYEFGIVNYELFSKRSKDVIHLVNLLMHDYKKNAKRSTGNAGGKKYTYDVFFPRKSLPIISEIDDLIADLYGFDNGSVIFLKTYDQQFRTDE
jgi:hypothetical protein